MKLHNRHKGNAARTAHRRSSARRETGAHREAGYALLMVIFMVALVMVALASAIPDVMQQGRREKEAELLYRGNQYERGIKLYYKKMGKYPQTLDDITHDQNGIHFMRQAYKDPMSKDGAWRLIYVDSNGILTNSLLFTSLQDMVTKLRPNSTISFGAPGGTPAPGGGIPGLSSPGSSPGGSGGFGSPSGGSGFGSWGGFGSSSQNSGSGGNNSTGVGSTQNSGNPTTTTQTYQYGSQPAGGAAGQQGQSGAPGQSVGFGGPGSPGGQSGDQSSSAGTDVSNSDQTGQVFGGQLTGVASMLDKPSIKIFQTGKTYKKWEFIWNPQLDAAAAAGGSAAPQGTAPNGTQGALPAGLGGPGAGGLPGGGPAPGPAPAGGSGA